MQGSQSSTMSSEECLAIIAEETGVPCEELEHNTNLADLGIDHILARAIAVRLSHKTSRHISPAIFDKCSNVQSLLQYLGLDQQAPRAAQHASKLNSTKHRGKRKAMPLVLRLQGNPEASSRNVFLLPDGSGSGMAYARLPRLGEGVCLYGVNSPFLGADSFVTTIEEMASVLVETIQDVQPHGPFTLGGWSAGGYLSTEVARLLMRGGESVECIVLIDSPCRLEYESLPLQAVQYLAPRNLMGNWANKETPEWMVKLFEGTLAAVAKYNPGKVSGLIPSIFIIEASEGVFATEQDVFDTGLDQDNMLTRHLLGPRPPKFNPHGWDKIFPDSKIQWAKSSGSHFTMVHPPYVSLYFLHSSRLIGLTFYKQSESLGKLLQDIVGAKGRDKQASNWTVWKN